MQAHPVHSQPKSPVRPAVRLLLAVPVAVFLAGVVSAAGRASHQAVDHMSAQLQPAAHAAEPGPLQIAAHREPVGCLAPRSQAS